MALVKVVLPGLAVAEAATAVLLGLVRVVLESVVVGLVVLVGLVGLGLVGRLHAKTNTRQQDSQANEDEEDLFFGILLFELIPYKCQTHSSLSNLSTVLSLSNQTLWQPNLVGQMYFDQVIILFGSQSSED